MDACTRDNCINKENNGMMDVNIIALVLMHHVVIMFVGHCKYRYIERMCLESKTGILVL